MKIPHFFTFVFRKIILVFRWISLVLGWGVPTIAFLDFVLNYFFKIEITIRIYFGLVLFFSWLVVFWVGLIYYFRKTKIFIVFSINTLFYFGLCYSYVENFDIKKTEKVKNYIIKASPNEINLYKENLIYRQWITKKSSTIFHDENDKMGLVGIAKITLLKETKQEIVLKIETRKGESIEKFSLF